MVSWMNSASVGMVYTLQGGPVITRWLKSRWAVLAHLGKLDAEEELLVWHTGDLQVC